MTERSILIRDALLVPSTTEAASAFVGGLLVEGNRIAALGEGIPSDYSADRIIEGNERALIPGLVNAHTHSHSSLTRGSAEGLPLETWLQVIESEQAQLTEEQAYYGALATYCEVLLSGTTLILDMCLFPEAALRAAQHVGIRAVIAPYVADAKPFAPTLDQTESLLPTISEDAERVRVWFGLHDLESCSDAQIRAGAELAERYDVGVHLHCSETEISVEKTLKRTGRRPVAHLAGLGALGPRTLLAHCVWVDKSDQEIIADAGAHVVHCPHANLKLGSGIAPIPSIIQAGINVSVGTDGAKTNNNLDMFDVMKFTSLLHKGAHLTPTVLPPELVFAMATRHGARALGVDAGALTPGMLADLTLVRLDRFHLQPAEPETIVTNLVHAARGSDVDLVMVDGQIVVADGVIQTVDQRKVLSHAARIGRSLLQKRQ